MSGLEWVLAGAGLLIGLTGTWSPCGFSMVATLGPEGHSGGRATTLAALAAFAPGALVGGLLTFGSLALLGELLHGAGGELPFAVAAGIAAVAALAEARGAPIVPQIRRQLPEHWRRFMPMPLAGGLYGVLLGLGFTTFVLSYGVWALAGISLALGDPALGLIIGVAFGAGRALPIAAIAPFGDRPAGIRATELMAERPGLLRGARLGDAAALASAAAALVIASPVEAATRSARGAGDPSAYGSDLVFQRIDGTAILRRNGDRTLPGTDPAVGGSFIAVREGGNIRLLGRRSLRRRATVGAAGADALAVSDSWLVYRDREGGADVIKAHPIAGASGGASAGGLGVGPPAMVAKAKFPAQLSPPSVSDDVLVYARATAKKNALVQHRLGTERKKRLLGSRKDLLFNPSVLGGSVLYVRTTNERQQLRLLRRGRGGLGRLLYSRGATSRRDPDHEPGHNRLPTRIPKPDLRRSSRTMWSTALGPDTAFVTLMGYKGRRLRAAIVRVPR